MSKMPDPRWDYSALAAHYDHRPDYSAELLRKVLDSLNPDRQLPWLDVGAGTGKLSRLLSPAAGQLIALEPNAAMRAHGLRNTAGRAIQWLAASGESIPLPNHSLGLIAYGSSHNVLDAERAHREATRLLASGGIWMAVWNHRDLADPLQQQVEALIEAQIPGYERGARRQNPLPDLLDRGGFRDAGEYQHRFEVEVNLSHWLDAWRSHATLQRQAGPRWESIQSAIAELARHALEAGSAQRLRVPYFTRLYWARRT